MQPESFYKILDHYTQWRLGTFPGSAGSTGRPAKDPDAAPERPYPVVQSFKEVTAQCGHCDQTCCQSKTYSKIIGTDKWRCRCQDCASSFQVTTQEMIKTGSFNIAKE